MRENLYFTINYNQQKTNLKYVKTYNSKYVKTYNSKSVIILLICPSMFITVIGYMCLLNQNFDFDLFCKNAIHERLHSHSTYIFKESLIYIYFRRDKSTVHLVNYYSRGIKITLWVKFVFIRSLDFSSDVWHIYLK